MMLEFTPFKNVGEFKLGADIKMYLKNSDFKFIAEHDATQWTRFENESLGVTLYVEDEKIISISCDKTFYYKQLNLIGATFKEFKKISNIKTIPLPEKMYITDDYFQNCIDIDELGMQIWMDEQIIVTVIITVW